MDLTLITYNGWCAMKPNQTKPNHSLLNDRLFCILPGMSRVYDVTHLKGGVLNAHSQDS